MIALFASAYMFGICGYWDDALSGPFCLCNDHLRIDLRSADVTRRRSVGAWSKREGRGRRNTNDLSQIRAWAHAAIIFFFRFFKHAPP